MKRFSFTLQSVYDYKLTVEKLQKAELSRARQMLMQLLAEEQRLLDTRAAAEVSLDEELKNGGNVITALAEYDVYFKSLRDEQARLKPRITRAEKNKDRCENELIKTMKELKTYLKLRDEQVDEYNKEVQAEEEKIMGDLVSFNIIKEDAN